MLIFEQSIRTQLGRPVVRIFDTNPDGSTPDLHRGEILGGVKLKQGDEGTSSDEIPAHSFGSYFKLEFVDNELSEFQQIFSEIGDEFRYRVEFDIPGFGVWNGFIKRQLQTRRIGQRNREDTVVVNCYDRLAALNRISRLQDTYNTDILTFLSDALALANPEVPIFFYWDVAGNSVNESDSTVAGPDRMHPYESLTHHLAPWSEKPEGLQGDTVRAQLDELCKKLHASLYYDVARSGWVFMDIAATGEEITEGGAWWYDGVEWEERDLLGQSVDINRGVDIRSDGEDILEQLPATNKVCFDIENLLTDPKQEQFDAEGVDELYWYDHPNAEVQESTHDQDESYSEVEIADTEKLERGQFMRLSLRDITHVRLRGSHERDKGTAFEYNTTIEYGDGTIDNYDGAVNTRGGSLEENPLYVPVDTSKDTIKWFLFNVFYTGSQTIGAVFQMDVAFVTEVQDTKPDGTTQSEFRVVTELCFEDEGVPGRMHEGETHSMVIRESNGSKASSEGFFSRRYDNVFYLPRWKGKNLISLQTKETEKLTCEVVPELIPLGHKVRFSKPGEAKNSHFVHLDGRTLHFATDEYDSGTSLNEMQIPNSVANLVKNQTF